MLKVLLVDDHAIFRAGLCPLLRELDPESILLEADNYEIALDIVAAEPDLDLLLADLVVPGGDGFDGLAAIRKRVPSLPIVVISMVEDRNDVLRAIDLGALGFVPKSAKPSEMLRALRLVMSGEMYLPPSIMKAATDGRSRKPMGAQPAISQSKLRALLTPRQCEVLAMLARGMTNAQIAGDMNLKESTIRVYVSVILDRLNLSNRTQAALMAAHTLDDASISGLVTGLSAGSADP